MSTKTSKAKLVTVFGTVNRHSLEVDVAPDASTPPYCQKGCTDPVNVPMPSAFATVTVPDPAVVVGPEETNTLMPPASAVVPSVVATAIYLAVSRLRYAAEDPEAAPDRGTPVR